MATKNKFRTVSSVFITSAVALMLVQLSVLPVRGENDQPPDQPSFLQTSGTAKRPQFFDGLSALTFQGLLTNASGQPVNTAIQATFRIYTHVNPSVASSPIWTSDIRNITPINGLFTVYLGDSFDSSFPGYDAAAVGVQVAPDTQEMTPRQPLNTVFGYGYVGVRGSGSFGVAGKGDETGVEGEGHWGVVGHTSSSRDNSVGVRGVSWVQRGTGVSAYNINPVGAALAIERGAFIVRNAGINTPTTAFIHTTSQTNLDQNCTFIDNPIANNNPNALLFVTHNLNPRGQVGFLYNNHTIGLWYSFDKQKWCIYNQDSAAMTLNLAFNVLIVVP
jgi:hypothetical protein